MKNNIMQLVGVIAMITVSIIMSSCVVPQRQVVMQPQPNQVSQLAWQQGANPREVQSVQPIAISNYARALKLQRGGDAQLETPDQVATITETFQWNPQKQGLAGVIDRESRKFFRNGPAGTLGDGVFKALISGGVIEWRQGAFRLPKTTADEANVNDSITPSEALEACLARKFRPNQKKPDAPADMPDLHRMVNERLATYGVVFR